MNVLLAEDNPVNQEVALGLLEMLDCTVTIAENGKETVDAAAHSSFDLILMDCQMPVMDGLEATRTIRAASSGEKRVPIVALTANDIEDARAECLAAGMDDLLGKPFTRDVLAALLQRWRTSAEPTSSSPSIDIEHTASSLDPAPIESLRAIDPEGARGLVHRTITKFLGYSDELMAQLAKAVTDRNITEISRIAHSLKSSSANLGATDLSKLCAKLEKLSEDDGSIDDIEQNVIALKAAQKIANRELQALIEAG